MTQRINWLKIAKTAVGAAIAAAIAYGLGLNYAVSAGIICLLTVCDTRKETLMVTLKRLMAFAAVTLLCTAVFSVAGFSIPALGLVLAIFLAFCSALDINEAAAMNSVIATHYFASADCSPQMMQNELTLFVIGAGIGVLMNIFVPTGIGRIRSIQKETDEKIRRIISRMSVYILAEDKSGYTGSCFDETSRLLADLKNCSLRYIGNSFAEEKDYFLKYVEMRISQCGVLMGIYKDIMALNPIHEYGKPISDFLAKMSGEFHEINDAAGLLENIDGLFAHYSAEKLPADRSEFESRALMYHIIWDLKRFVTLKADFAAELSENEKKRYWNIVHEKK